MSKMYNRNALNRIATRDQLDRAIVLISPSLWISIIGALLIIAGLCVWGFQGKLPTSIDTSGIYLDELKRIKDLDTRIGYVEDITFDSELDILTGDTEALAQIKLEAENRDKLYWLPDLLLSQELLYLWEQRQFRQRRQQSLRSLLVPCMQQLVLP